MLLDRFVSVVKTAFANASLRSSRLNILIGVTSKIVQSFSLLVELVQSVCHHPIVCVFESKQDVCSHILERIYSDESINWKICRRKSNDEVQGKKNIYYKTTLTVEVSMPSVRYNVNGLIKMLKEHSSCRRFFLHTDRSISRSSCLLFMRQVVVREWTGFNNIRICNGLWKRLPLFLFIWEPGFWTYTSSICPTERCFVLSHGSIVVYHTFHFLFLSFVFIYLFMT